MSNNRETLQELFNALAEALVSKVKSGDATAADLNVARQLLKDNGIEAEPVAGTPLRSLVDSLPFSGDSDGDGDDEEPYYNNIRRVK